MAAIPNYFHKYDVFISFRGADTRKNFTSHLYEALRRRKIKTYLDEETLERGEEITSSLLKAIEESRISLIIFSENYASSTWCLDELVHILKCKRNDRQIVIPVFHGVDPSHVRNQEGCYGQAFVAQEQRFKDYPERVQEWRAALEEAGGLAGWDTRDRYESRLIQKIVKNVVCKLHYTNVDFKGVVGMEKSLEKIEHMLCIGSPDVRIIGIWGMGGIGKTALASVLYNKFCSQFEGSCFLGNIKEESEKHGLTYLQDKMFSVLKYEENSSTVKQIRVNFKTALIVLDEINSREQLECLAGDRNWFGSGSKIIVTSRNLQLLIRCSAIDEIFKVGGLLDHFNEALQIFNLNSFGDKFKRTCNVNPQPKSRVHPLVLNKVLGSSLLRSETIKAWECTLNKLKSGCINHFWEVMSTWYNGLGDKEKVIFLGIAFQFKGQYRGFAQKILDRDRNSSSKMGIEVLMRTSLISIKGNGKIWMHDLVQEMAWELDREKSIKEPRRGCWSWISQDKAHNVLKDYRTIGGIHFGTSKLETKLHLMPPLYQKRYLNLQNPLESSLSTFEQRNLVALDMPCNVLKQFWRGIRDMSSSVRLLISYEGQWRTVEQGLWSFEGQKAKGITVSKDITFHELVERLHSILMIDGSQYDLDIRFLVNSVVPMAPIVMQNDEDVSFFIGENSCKASSRYPLCVTLVRKSGTSRC